MDLVTRANRIAATLAGESATCCPLCLVSLAEELATGVAVRELDRVRTDGHAFWNACVAAVIKLFEDTAPGRHGILESTIATCPREHGSAGRLPNVVQVLVNALCHILSAGLTRGAHSGFERAKKRRGAFASARGHWPTEPAQLFPGGPHRLLCALVHWGADGQSRYPIAVLAELATVALPFVFRTIIGSPRLHIDTLTLFVDRLRGEPVDEDADGVTLQEQDVSRRRTTRSQGIMAVALFLGALQSGPDAGANDLLSFAGPRGQDVFGAVVDALEFFNCPRTDMYKALALVANRLQQNLGLPVSVLPAPILACRGPELDIQDIIVVLLRTVREQKRRCSGPGCGLYVQEHEPGMAFRPCADCLVVHYCSRACQRRDWNGGSRVAHAQVCAAIRRLVDARDYHAAYAACSPREMSAILEFALSHTALHDELRQRAVEILGQHHDVGLRTLMALSPDVRMAAMHEIFG
ncbi:hypothetical protein AURDEDRAFT_130788 [Auricularia subglabra TFB-10046 SS5]|uniref:MYND-type domain-containing protein n=1 Tax=Auricularia subglabra (strain TFB-10046 / SS5) TaxID=717982 RepID=J0D7P2_AURST|nr:hypothetical protein AURDEDRAFT_130788 [Auricularia subglabra TFB-10046 SS5]